MTIVIIIAIFTSFITSNISSQSQTVKSEAEKLAMFITDLTRKADRRHMNFTIVLHFNSAPFNAYCYFGKNTKNRTYIYHENPDKIEEGYDKKIIVAPGFTLSLNFTNDIVYDADKNEFSYADGKIANGKFILTRTLDDSKYYIHLRNGRIRASESESDEEETE